MNQAQVFIYMRPDSHKDLAQDIFDSSRALDVGYSYHNNGRNHEIRLFGNEEGVERIARAILYIDRKALYAN